MHVQQSVLHVQGGAVTACYGRGVLLRLLTLLLPWAPASRGFIVCTGSRAVLCVAVCQSAAAQAVYAHTDWLAGWLLLLSVLQSLHPTDRCCSSPCTPQIAVAGTPPGGGWPPLRLTAADVDVGEQHNLYTTGTRALCAQHTELQPACTRSRKQTAARQDAAPLSLAHLLVPHEHVPGEQAQRQAARQCHPWQQLLGAAAAMALLVVRLEQLLAAGGQQPRGAAVVALLLRRRQRRCLCVRRAAHGPCACR